MKEKLIFFLILGLAFFLRVWQLDSVPPSASLDEASIGYNAYSILQTGADEYGTKFPLLLRAYDDWRPALYVYFVIPFVKIMGLNVVAVRLPSVILSILTVIAVYFLCKRLFKDSTYSQKSSAYHLSLITSFLLAISPWHIYISRLGHEVNAGLAFFIFALLSSVKKRIFLSAVFFSLSFASYQSEKVFLPILLFGGLIIYREEIKKIWKKILLAGVFSLIFLSPFLWQSFQPNALIRFQATNILEAKKEELAGKAGLQRRFKMVQIITTNYLTHFKPQWLFKNNGPEPHKVPALGIFYWWEGLIMAIGLIWLIRHIGQKNNQFLLWWLVVAPIPAALTTDAPHAMRTMQVLPVPQILVSLGLLSILGFLKNRFTVSVLSPFFLVTCFLSLISFYQNYFYVFPKEQSRSFQYALKDAINYVSKHEQDYDKIIFSNKDDLYQSYMFYLFYTKYDPLLYQGQGGTISGGFAEAHKFGKYEFRPIEWKNEEKNEKTLYMGNIGDFPAGSNFFKKFKLLSGDEVIAVVKK